MNLKILEAARKTIPKTSNLAKHPPVHWWSPEVALAIKARKRALREYRKRKASELFIEFKRKRALARNLIRTKRKESWIKFISLINNSMSTKYV